MGVVGEDWVLALPGLLLSRNCLVKFVIWPESHTDPDRNLLTRLVKQPVCLEVSFLGSSHLAIQISRQMAAIGPVRTRQPIPCVEGVPNVRGDLDPALSGYRGLGKEDTAMGIEKRGFSLCGLGWGWVQKVGVVQKAQSL